MRTPIRWKTNSIMESRLNMTNIIFAILHRIKIPKHYRFREIKLKKYTNFYVPSYLKTPHLEFYLKIHRNILHKILGWGVFFSVGT